MHPKKTCVAAIALFLSACGGGGAPITSNPPPPPAPTPTPTPTPTPPRDISNLTSDQTFDVQSGHEAASFDLGNGDTLSSQSSKSGVVIAYDAGSDSYTLTEDSGRTATFSPADEIELTDTSQRRFQVSNGSKSDFLTLAHVGYGSGLETDSVALGFWQSNLVSGTVQDTKFDVFVYGFPSTFANVPVTGSANFRTDVFGFTSQVGFEPISFQGSGATVFDFLRGTFEMDTTVSENFLFTEGGTGGALWFRAAGNISSSANSFDGTFIYDGSQTTITGLLNGAFFGEEAEEAGGTFVGDDGLGNSVVGGFTAGLPKEVDQNLSVYELQFDETFFTGASTFERRTYKDGTAGFSYAGLTSNSQFSYRASDNSYRVAGVAESEGLFSPADLVTAPDAPFEVYRKSGDLIDYELTLYQPANGGQVELTYSGFGAYRRLYEDAAQLNTNEQWFMFGIDTLEGVLDARTGSATYNGIARGSAGSADGRRDLAVNGTSQFVIDFLTQGYSGWLRLEGTDNDDGSLVDFGQIDLAAGNGYNRNAFTTALKRSGSDVGEIQLRFYGPTGEELAGVFGLTVDGFSVAGATAAKRD